MEHRVCNLYKGLLIVFFLFYFIQYLSDILFGGSMNYAVFDIIVFLGFYISYLIIYRKNNLLCFELMALPIAFLGLFFDNIVLPLVPELSSYFSISNISSKIKSEDVQMVAYFAFLLGCVIGNEKKSKTNCNKITSIKKSTVNYDFLIYFISGLLALLIIYDYYAGIFSTWFFYSNVQEMVLAGIERNQGLDHLTCLLLAGSAVEVVRLRNKGVTTFWLFFRKSNKFFLLEWLFVAGLLFITGNRNEMLLILLPLIVGYTVCIKTISNKIMIGFGLVGVILMAIAGMTRGEGVTLQGDQLGVLAFTRDFADLGYNTDFLIDYTDKMGATYFEGIMGAFISGIPYFGQVILKALDYHFVVSSTTLATESVMAGVGTSLIGDLYYTAGGLWVYLYLFLLGNIMSRLYHSGKNINIYLLIFYIYMVSNAIYYVRSTWLFPVAEIEYTMIIVFVGQFIFMKRKNLISQTL